MKELRTDLFKVGYNLRKK